MKINPFTLMIKLCRYLHEDVKTSEQIEDMVWKEDVDAWIGGTLEWLNNPNVLPPSHILEEVFSTAIAAEGYSMLNGNGYSKKLHRSIHNLLEYILRSEGKVNISCVPEDGAVIKRDVVHPACNKAMIDAFMNFSKGISDVQFYQLCGNLNNVDPRNCPHYTSLLVCGYTIDRGLTFPKDIRLCDNCMDLYYVSSLTPVRSKTGEYTTDCVQGFDWLKRTINAIFIRNEMDKNLTDIRKEVAFIIWYFGLIKASRMKTKTEISSMLQACVSRFRRRIEQKELV